LIEHNASNASAEADCGQCLASRRTVSFVAVTKMAMAFADPSMDDDLRETPAGHKIVLGEDWADI